MHEKDWVLAFARGWRDGGYGVVVSTVGVLFGEDDGVVLTAVGGGARSVVFRVVDMPEGQDEAVFCVDFVFFDVEADATGVVADVANQGVVASFYGFEIVLLAASGCIFHVLHRIATSLPLALSLPSPCCFSPCFSPPLFFFVKGSSGIRILESQAEVDMAYGEWYGSEQCSQNDGTKEG